MYKMRDFDFSMSSPEGQILVEFVESLKPKRTLEVGCNYGKELRQINKLTEIYGLDNSKKQIKRAKKYLPSGNFIFGEGEKTPFPDEHFDLVYTAGCLSHNPPKKLPLLLDELIRVSKKYVLLIEYIGSKTGMTSIGNPKTNTWIHDYEKFCATKDVTFCLNRDRRIGTDIYKTILLRKNNNDGVVKEYVKLYPREDKELLHLNLWKFNFKIMKKEK